MAETEMIPARGGPVWRGVGGVNYRDEKRTAIGESDRELFY
jgi:hypothetical protein